MSLSIGYGATDAVDETNAHIFPNFWWNRVDISNNFSYIYASTYVSLTGLESEWVEKKNKFHFMMLLDFKLNIDQFFFREIALARRWQRHAYAASMESPCKALTTT